LPAVRGSGEVDVVAGIDGQLDELQTPNGAPGALPVTVPPRLAVNVTVTRSTNSAITVVVPFRVTSQAPAPEQPPPVQSLWRKPA
jgi:hypothetical protein